MSMLIFLLATVVIPMLVSEVTDWFPWLATKMVKVAARGLPPYLRDRYAEEWEAEVRAVPGGGLSKVAVALRIWLGAPRTGATLRGLPSARAALTKSVFDRLSVAVILIIMAPLLVAIAIMIRLHDGGPVFVRQTRIGRDGEAFRLFGFRTMVVDAEERKLEIEAANLKALSSGATLFKMRKDPRITKVGGKLRRWSLDELPQLFNVLLGDMSLVGPRPALPHEVARYGDHMRRRLVVKPGLTGLWQVSGRSRLSWEDAFRLDLRYVMNWYFMLDLHILWRTVRAVIRGSWTR
jgi:lipopolysaccharide/colanic/teichoic acid biosynthesis glycosyltransferase